MTLFPRRGRASCGVTRLVAVFAFFRGQPLAGAVSSAAPAGNGATNHLPAGQADKQHQEEEKEARAFAFLDWLLNSLPQSAEGGPAKGGAPAPKPLLRREDTEKNKKVPEAKELHVKTMGDVRQATYEGGARSSSQMASKAHPTAAVQQVAPAANGGQHAGGDPQAAQEKALEELLGVMAGGGAGPVAPEHHPKEVQPAPEAAAAQSAPVGVSLPLGVVPPPDVASAQPSDQPGDDSQVFVIARKGEPPLVVQARHPHQHHRPPHQGSSQAVLAPNTDVIPGGPTSTASSSSPGGGGAPGGGNPLEKLMQAILGGGSGPTPDGSADAHHSANHGPGLGGGVLLAVPSSASVPDSPTGTPSALASSNDAPPSSASPGGPVMAASGDGPEAKAGDSFLNALLAPLVLQSMLGDAAKKAGEHRVAHGAGREDAVSAPQAGDTAPSEEQALQAALSAGAQQPQRSSPTSADAGNGGGPVSASDGSAASPAAESHAQEQHELEELLKSIVGDNAGPSVPADRAKPKEKKPAAQPAAAETSAAGRVADVPVDSDVPEKVNVKSSSVEIGSGGRTVGEIAAATGVEKQKKVPEDYDPPTTAEGDMGSAVQVTPEIPSLHGSAGAAGLQTPTPKEVVSGLIPGQTPNVPSAQTGGGVTADSHGVLQPARELSSAPADDKQIANSLPGSASSAATPQSQPAEQQLKAPAATEKQGLEGATTPSTSGASPAAKSAPEPSAWDNALGLLKRLAMVPGAALEHLLGDGGSDGGSSGEPALASSSSSGKGGSAAGGASAPLAAGSGTATATTPSAQQETHAADRHTAEGVTAPSAAPPLSETTAAAAGATPPAPGVPAAQDVTSAASTSTVANAAPTTIAVPAANAVGGAGALTAVVPGAGMPANSAVAGGSAAATQNLGNAAPSESSSLFSGPGK
mmetsp:Transcript_14384/g.35889  ORF Transcript_14384/g.35889 Transcript_14384/m.35889 type:complete len:923 (+) Transcript_14384:32-2800(+)